MTVANATLKNVIIADQSAQGTIAAVDAATAQSMRFKSWPQDQTNENYTSDEMRPDRQVGDVNIGPQDCNGSCNGEFSPGTYQRFTEAILRKVFVVAGADTANVGVAAAATTGAAGTFTRDDGGGDWLADMFKVGDVIQMTGWTTDGATNNLHNFLITALTDTVMTVMGVDGVPPAAKIKGDSVVTAVKGFHCWIPATGHTNDWFTIEHCYSDLDTSETFWDCKVGKMSIKAPATGIPTVDFDILGLNMTPQASGSSPYFTTPPAAITTTEVVHSGEALILISGTEQTLATGIDIEINSNSITGGAVMGTNLKGGIYDKRVEVKGTFSLLYADDTISALYRAGTEVSISAVFPTTSAAASTFIAITIPVAKLTGANKQGDNEITTSFGFTGKVDATGDDGVTCTVDSIKTTMSIQDSTILA